MPVFSSHFLFQVIDSLPTPLFRRLLFCALCRQIVGMVVLLFAFPETSLFNRMFMTSEAKSPRKKFNCTLGWMQH
jgi:hypothetical protein